MSIVNEENEKVLLPRVGPDEFWNRIKTFAGKDKRKWKYLVMLALRENAGWPLSHIALAFQHQPGHVTRCLNRIKEELREYFLSLEDGVSPEDPGERGASAP